MRGLGRVAIPEVFHATTPTPTGEDGNVDEGTLLLLLGAILAASLVVALGAARTGLPVLVAFLALGMLLGSDGPGGIEFDDAKLAREVGIIGLAAILFEGGLQTSWRRLRQVAVPAALLSTVGVAVSAILTGVAAYWLFDLSWLESVLLGAVVVDGRRRGLRHAPLHPHPPPARAPARGGVGRQRPDGDRAHARTDRVDRAAGRLRRGRPAPAHRRTARLGLVVGVVLGLVAMWVFARIPPSIGAFAPVASVAAGALSFGAADVIGGSGFLSVYIVGLAVGSTPSRYRRQLVAFHEGLAFLAQVALFIVLGLLVFPSDLLEVALPGLALSFILMLVIRPAAVWAATAYNDLTANDRWLIGWAGLRGAVPIVLATFVLSSDVTERETIFNAVFVVVVSVIVQGTTLEWVAGRLGLLAPAPPAHEPPLEVGPLSQLDLVDFLVVEDHAIKGAAVREWDCLAAR